MRPRPKHRLLLPRPNRPSLLWLCAAMTVRVKRKPKPLQVVMVVMVVMAAAMAVRASGEPVRVVTVDLAAGTLVIYREQPLVRPRIPQAAALRLPFALNLNEQRAILGFAERQGELSAERVHELASILATPLQVSPARAVEQLNGVARGLLGPT